MEKYLQQQISTLNIHPGTYKNYWSNVKLIHTQSSKFSATTDWTNYSPFETETCLSDILVMRKVSLEELYCSDSISCAGYDTNSVNTDYARFSVLQIFWIGAK